MSDMESKNLLEDNLKYLRYEKYKNFMNRIKKNLQEIACDNITGNAEIEAFLIEATIAKFEKAAERAFVLMSISLLQEFDNCRNLKSPDSANYKKLHTERLNNFLKNSTLFFGEYNKGEYYSYQDAEEKKADVEKIRDALDHRCVKGLEKLTDYLYGLETPKDDLEAAIKKYDCRGKDYLPIEKLPSLQEFDDMNKFGGNITSQQENDNTDVQDYITPATIKSEKNDIDTEENINIKNEDYESAHDLLDTQDNGPPPVLSRIKNRIITFIDKHPAISFFVAVGVIVISAYIGGWIGSRFKKENAAVDEPSMVKHVVYDIHVGVGNKEPYFIKNPDASNKYLTVQMEDEKVAEISSYAIFKDEISLTVGGLEENSATAVLVKNEKGNVLSRTEVIVGPSTIGNDGMNPEGGVD